MIAYIWNSGTDRFEWAGDTQGFFGIDAEDGPCDNARFHKLLNPMEVPERLSALHDALGRDPEHGPGSKFTANYKLRRSDGVTVEIEESASVQYDEDTGHKLLCGVLKVQGSVHSASGAARHAENVVPAPVETGFVNYGRIAMQRKIEEWFDTRDHGRRSFGYFLAVGIDRMALYNDVMGTRYADEIIEKTGDRLRQIVGASGHVMRIDGDVYGMFFREAPHNEMAAVAKYVLNNFYNVPLDSSRGPVGVGVSVGGVTLNRAADPPSALTMAEMAMRVAKDKGRSCFVSYEEAASDAEDNRFLLQSADTLMRAMKDDRLRFAFQPVMGSRNNAVSFHECLMRLIDDKGTLVSAGEFIPAIERLGLSRLVDQFALKMAVQELSMFPDVTLSVNVSNLTLADPDWLRNLVASLRDRPSVARRLIVEITESAVIYNIDKTKQIVRTLQDLGCRVALDDFGAGYTAFSQLKDLQVDIVKIDKHFIRNIGEEHNHLFVRTLRTLAEGVNVETVGEGAETLAEAKLLATDGIDHIQGFVYGFPRVERVWLPKDHLHREISLQKKPSGSTVMQEVTEDIAAWARGG